MSDTGTDLDVIDLARLADWMDDEGLERGPVVEAELLGGGTQNILVRFRRGDRRFVLRRGPRHLRPRSNDQLRREVQVLTALGDTEVRHPTLVAACLDETVLGGAVFYLMEPVDGFNATTVLPELHAARAEIRHEMGLEAARAVATLGNVDHVAVGLDGFGKPEGFLERQVARWMSELESYSRFEEYPGPEIPGVEQVAGWLSANLPTGSRTGIVHGDYHLANVMYSYDGPELTAIVDWEMCTIGDPLLDLGWLLATWPAGDGQGVGGSLGGAGGLPTSDELVAAYRQASTGEVVSVEWYTAMACFKLGIVLEGTNARAWAGKAPRAVGDQLHATTLGLFERARQITG